MDWTPLWISLKTAIPATLFTFILGIYAAHKIRQLDDRLVQILDVVFTLPLVLPPTVMGFLLLQLFGKHGLLGKALEITGIQIIFTGTAAVIAAVVVSFPLMYRSAKAAFEQVDPNLIYAARTVKLSELQIFWKIILPIALPGVASGTILAFARALGEFGATLMIAGNIPGKTQTMPLAIYMAIQSGDEGRAAAWAGLLLALSFIMILSMNRFTRKDKRNRREERHGTVG